MKPVAPIAEPKPEAKTAEAAAVPTAPVPAPAVKKEIQHLPPLPDVPFTTLTTYSYYESGKKHVKALITLDGIEKHPKEKIEVHFTDRAMEVLILDFKGKNYIFKVPKLQCRIQSANSTFAIKANTVVVNLCKEKEDDHWWSLFKTKAVCEVDSD